MYSYSLKDRELATLILSQSYEVDRDSAGLFYNTEKPLYRASFITWAQKCLRWFARFYQVLRAYSRPAGGAVFALKAIWINLHRGKSLVAMLREVYHIGTEAAEATYQKPRFTREDTKRNGQPIQYIRPHSNKTERRGQIIRITNNLQTI